MHLFPVAQRARTEWVKVIVFVRVVEVGENELGEGRLVTEQLLECAHLGDLSVLQHYNRVHLLQVGYTAGHQDSSLGK